MMLVVKNLPASAGDPRDMGLSPGSGRFLEEEMTTHSNILAGRIPWTEECGGLQSMGLQRVRHDLATNIYRIGQEIYESGVFYSARE